MKYDSTKAGNVLKSMRERRKLSQREMAVLLANIVQDRALDGDNGKNTVSQLENGGRGITLKYAFAYADVFNVSLDYIYGRDNDPNPENKAIRETIGLSDDAIRELSELKNDSIDSSKKKSANYRALVSLKALNRILECSPSTFTKLGRFFWDKYSTKITSINNRTGKNTYLLEFRNEHADIDDYLDTGVISSAILKSIDDDFVRIREETQKEDSVNA